MTVPLAVYVGERSLIEIPRRLNVYSVTRLALSLLSGQAAVYIDNVRLEAEPPLLTAFPGLVRLDLGIPGAPVEKGFAALLPSGYYTATRGYGIAPSSTVASAADRRHPTDLLRDWIAFTSGGLDLDLPDDTYTVVLFLKDPGEWE